MKKISVLEVLIVFLAFSATLFAYPSVYPTGTTIYKPDAAWSGYTIHPTPDSKGTVLIDMNGNVIRRWANVTGGPARILPGGIFVGRSDQTGELLQLDWEGNVVWGFSEALDSRGNSISAETQHHDWQREGFSAGYYAPESEPRVVGGKTLLLLNKSVVVPEISDHQLLDDYLVEVSWDGEVLWEWLASEHVDEMGFSAVAREAIRNSTVGNPGDGPTDWLHFNAAAYLGPNQWHDRGDERFHPDHVIFSSREANLVGIIARSGKIVWRLGPDFRETEEMESIGQIIGQHNPHFIPPGLPGEGNVLVFDNGGAAGYGASTATAPNGRNIVERRYSRVLEINPVTMEKVWEYSISGHGNFRFFSWNVSSAQRLPNGNTLITEGAPGRVFEVTVDGEIVWEYVNPFFYESDDTRHNMYRAYRVPYDWIPQLERPDERAVIPPHPSEFRVEAQR